LWRKDFRDGGNSTGKDGGSAMTKRKQIQPVKSPKPKTGMAIVKAHPAAASPVAALSDGQIARRLRPKNPETSPALVRTDQEKRGIMRDAKKVAFGVRHEFTGDLLWSQIEKALDPWSRQTPEDALNPLSLVSEIGPRNALESMLATQMIATHMAALDFLQRARRPEQLAEAIDPNVVRAGRFLRLFTEQLEAWSKLKGTAGQQRVVVEHVNVMAGGQAIVGQVTAGPGVPTGGEKP
jgi:hypothetical protein